MIPEAVQTWLENNDHGSVRSSRSVGGGCINDGAILQTTCGATFFLKTNRHTPPDMFALEAEGLVALRTAEGAPVVPEPYLHGSDFLLLEDLAPAKRKTDYWENFGRRLALLHNQTNPQFGFHHDNYIGSTTQPNPWTEDGYAFFAQQRLLFQARLANERGLLHRSDVLRTEKMANRLRELVPAQPASLIHGDLWSGNAISDSRGEPAVIDPAAHYGWAEAELAMTALFGSFPGAFYHAYQEVRALEPGFADRYPVYNLYHLLNHLNLFGVGYLGQVQFILNKYGAF
jgi:fructosamine-3-kinase